VGKTTSVGITAFPARHCRNKDASSFFCFAKRTKSIGGILSPYHDFIPCQPLTRKFRLFPVGCLWIYKIVSRQGRRELTPKAHQPATSATFFYFLFCIFYFLFFSFVICHLSLFICHILSYSTQTSSGLPSRRWRGQDHLYRDNGLPGKALPKQSCFFVLLFRQKNQKHSRNFISLP